MEQQETLTKAIKPYKPKLRVRERVRGKEEAVEGGAEGCVHICTTLFHQRSDSQISLALSLSLIRAHTYTRTYMHTHAPLKSQSKVSHLRQVSSHPLHTPLRALDPCSLPFSLCHSFTLSLTPLLVFSQSIQILSSFTCQAVQEYRNLLQSHLSQHVDSPTWTHFWIDSLLLGQPWSK